jgi:hypothetical protein
MRVRYAITAAALGVGLAVGGTVALASAASPTVSIGNCTSEGSFIQCSVQGDIHHPTVIRATVWATGRTRVQVSWLNSCQNGFTTGERTGQYTVTATPAHKSVRRIPLVAGHAGTCTPVVSASLTGSGRVHLVLNGTN